jgi:hypothetical protein
MLGDYIVSSVKYFSPLEKKHNVVAFHRVQEGIAGKVMSFACIDGE